MEIKFFFKKLSTLNSQLSTSSGFTLLELLISFAIIAFLSLVGIASFIRFNRSQILNTAAADFTGALNISKSRTLSQVRSCTGTLKGYKLGLCGTGGCESGEAGKSYAIYAICESIPSVPPTLILSKSLPGNFTIVATGGSNSFLFEVLTGTVDFTGTSPEVITITGYDGGSKQVSVYKDGRILSN